MSKTKIKRIQARKLWDTGGQPAIEIDVVLRYGAQGRIIARLPASLRASHADIDAGIASVNGSINRQMKGKSARDQADIDAQLTAAVASDGIQPIVPHLLNALSSACLWAMADTEKLPLWQYAGTFLGQGSADHLPMPVMSIWSPPQMPAGGRCIRDFSIIPVGAGSFAEALVWSVNVHAAAHTADVDPAASDIQVMEALVRAIENAGLRPGLDIGLALGVAPAETPQPGLYRFSAGAPAVTTDSLSGHFVDWVAAYPIVSLEDPFAGDDLEGFRRLTWAVGKRTQVLASPYRNAVRPEPAAEPQAKIGNALPIPDAGHLPLTALRDLSEAAAISGLSQLFPPEPGGQQSLTAIHLAVGWDIPQIRFEPPGNTMTTLLWNEGLRIAETLSEVSGGALSVDGQLPPRTGFAWG